MRASGKLNLAIQVIGGADQRPISLIFYSVLMKRSGFWQGVTTAVDWFFTVFEDLEIRLQIQRFRARQWLGLRRENGAVDQA